MTHSPTGLSGFDICWDDDESETKDCVHFQSIHSPSWSLVKTLSVSVNLVNLRNPSPACKLDNVFKAFNLVVTVNRTRPWRTLLFPRTPLFLFIKRSVTGRHDLENNKEEIEISVASLFLYFSFFFLQLIRLYSSI